jgi:hypothetical protein
MLLMLFDLASRGLTGTFCGKGGEVAAGSVILVEIRINPFVGGD